MVVLNLNKKLNKVKKQHAIDNFIKAERDSN